MAIAMNWKTLSGDTHWKDMLDPPSPDLRNYIIHYGEMAEATYDAFIKVKASKNAGNSRYARKNLLSRVGLIQGRPLNQYFVTKYIYATSAIPIPGAFVISSSTHAWSRKSNWIAFVAVATDEGKKVLGRRDILVAWRGTEQASDMVYDSEFLLVPGPKVFGLLIKDNPKIHQGWYSIYTSDDPTTRYNKTSARDQVLGEVKRLVNEYRFDDISLSTTGHSMGAALATLNAVDIVVNGVNQQTVVPPKACPVTVFGFASPRVGDSNFHKVFTSQTGLYCLRISNALDVVPKFPALGYMDVGNELRIDTTKSGYLKGPGNFGSWHNMEGYMHGVAGTQGRNGGFKLEVNRDISLVNKFLDGLKDEHGVPGSWWCEKNTGMIQKDDGSWELNDREEDDDSDP